MFWNDSRWASRVAAGVMMAAAVTIVPGAFAGWICIGTTAPSNSVQSASATYNGGGCSASYGLPGLTYQSTGSSSLVPSPNPMGQGLTTAGLTLNGGVGLASAFASLDQGILRANAGASPGSLVAASNVSFADTLHFVITDNATSVPVTIRIRLAGNQSGTGSYNNSFFVSFLGASFSYFTASNPPGFGEGCGGCAPLGWTSYAFSNQTASGFDFIGTVNLDRQHLDQFVQLGLILNCSPGETCDYTNAAAISWVLPPNVTYISDSGAFLRNTPLARMNAGGATYVDPQGGFWWADANLPNTFTFQTQNPIRNTTTPALYQSERFSLGTPFQYIFSSVPNGLYNVRLMFAETYFTQPGQRKFNVNLNGSPALTNFDIVAAAGGSNTAVDTLHTVNVTSGQITVQLVPVLSNPKISAIEIVPQTTAIALMPGISDPLVAGATQQFTATVIGTANQAVTYTLTPNLGNITAGGLYTAPAVANPTKVTVTSTSQADNSKSATAVIQLVPQAWATQDVGSPNFPGSSVYTGNAFNLTGAGDLLGTSDAFRFTFNKLTGDGSLIARVNQSFTGQTSNKSGVMMRNDLTPGSSYGFTGLYSSIVGLFHWRSAASAATNFQFGAAGVPWVRLTRTGNTLTSYVSNDAVAWIPVGSPQTLSSAGVNVGLAAANGFAPALDTVTFDNIDLSTSPVAVSINEGLSSLAASQQAQFTANVTGTANTAVTWSASPAGLGAIDANTGVYTAPTLVSPSPQTVTITATSVADPSRAASILVTLGAFQTIRVNAGGPSHYDPTGTFWFGDVGAVGGAGNVYSAGNSIANTLTPYLYQSERFVANAPLVYKYYVPNGSYNVTLKFAEIFFTTAGQRVMNISINGTSVLSNFDIVALAGANTAIDRTFPVTVNNGAITISLSPAVAGHTPKVNAIQIQ